jgi:hypothetical protein
VQGNDYLNQNATLTVVPLPEMSVTLAA